MSRTFNRATRYAPDAQSKRSEYEVSCSQCGATEFVTNRSETGDLPPAMIANKFRQKGWQIANKPGRDICPACSKTSRKKESITMGEEADQIIATPSRPMSRDEGRLIFAKLQDCYIDEKSGYDKGWSDKRVAEDLGVPRDWVRSVREEFFGLTASNEEVVNATIDVENVIARLEDMRAQFDREIDEIVSCLRREIAPLKKPV